MSEMGRRESFDPGAFDRIVVKVGSASMLEQGAARTSWLRGLAQDVADLRRARRCRVVVMSSGALALGRRRLSTVGVVDAALEALGAVGQIGIASAWRDAFSAVGVVSGQLLLTPMDVASGRAQAAIETLWQSEVIPCINENIPLLDSFDNDGLAVSVAQAVGAGALIFVSDVAGLFSADPRIDPDAVLLERVEHITDAMIASAGDSASAVGTGGMAAKLSAARSAVEAGCHAVFVGSDIEHPLRSLAGGVASTWFVAR